VQVERYTKIPFVFKGLEEVTMLTGLRIAIVGVILGFAAMFLASCSVTGVLVI